MSDPANVQQPRCQKFNIKGIQCCLPEGHEGAHEINPFDLQAEPWFSASLSDKTEKCGERAEAFIPREGESYACVLPKGHEGEHHGGGNCFRHGEYVGIRGCPVCFPDGAQVGFGSASDKTELRAAIDAAVHELASMLPKNKTLSDAGHLIVGDIIERHIAPLLRSVRIAAIEECAKLILERIKRDWWPHSNQYEEGVNHVVAIRALKEKP